MKVHIGKAQHVAGPFLAAVKGEGLIDDDEAAFNVFDIEIVGNEIDQGLERDALLGHGALDLEFGDVFMGCHPAAVGHGLVADTDCPTVPEFGGPRFCLFAGIDLGAPTKIVVDDTHEAGA